MRPSDVLLVLCGTWFDIHVMSCCLLQRIAHRLVKFCTICTILAGSQTKLGLCIIKLG